MKNKTVKKELNTVKKLLYDLRLKTSHINRFFFLSTSLKKETVTKAMLYFFVLYKEKIIQLIYTNSLAVNRIKGLSKRLSLEFGKGFSQRNIEQMRQFYRTYSKTQTLSAEFNLSWSHYLKLMRIDNENERKYYEIEAYKNNWRT